MLNDDEQFDFEDSISFFFFFLSHILLQPGSHDSKQRTPRTADTQAHTPIAYSDNWFWTIGIAFPMLIWPILSVTIVNLQISSQASVGPVGFVGIVD